MEDKRGDSIEFQEINSDSQDSQLTGLVRNSFRIPLMAKKNYTVTIKKNSYHLVDMANGGVAFNIAQAQDFMVGGILLGCGLVLNGQIFENLKCEVVHLSLGNDQGWICGIRWLDLGERDIRTINGIVRDLRKELFQNRSASQE